MGDIVFVLGGARSGKTAFAQGLAGAFQKSGGPPVTYIATAEGGDEEMRRRIAKHRESRPGSWKTIEEPLYPSRVLAAAGDSCALLLDCLTLLISNHMMAGEGLPPEELEKSILTETRRFLDAAEGGAVPTIIVSNEVGVGLLSPNALGRLFQDISGAVHQLVAARAGEVYFLVAGIPQKLK